MICFKYVFIVLAPTLIAMETDTKLSDPANEKIKGI